MPTEHTWKNVHNSVTQGNARNPPKCPPGTGIMLRTTKATPQITRSNTAPQRKRGKVRNVPASGRQVWEGFRKSQSVQGSIDKMLLLTELGLGGQRSRCWQIWVWWGPFWTAEVILLKILQALPWCESNCVPPVARVLIPLMGPTSP